MTYIDDSWVFCVWTVIFLTSWRLEVPGVWTCYQQVSINVSSVLLVMWNLNSVCININHTKAVQKMNISISKIRTCISAVKRLLVFQQSHLIKFLFYSNLLYLNITLRDSTNVTIYTLSPINQAKSDLHDRVFSLNYNWTRVFDKVRTPAERCRVLFTQEMTSHNTVKYCLQQKLRHSTQQSIIFWINDVTVRS